MMMGGPPGMSEMSGSSAPQMQLGKKKTKKQELPKLIDDNNGKIMWRVMINRSYQLYYIINNFFKKMLWFGSCLSLMYFFPMAIEYMGEQNRILAKISMQMSGEMGGPMMGGMPPPMM